MADNEESNEPAANAVPAPATALKSTAVKNKDITEPASFADKAPKESLKRKLSESRSSSPPATRRRSSITQHPLPQPPPLNYDDDDEEEGEVADNGQPPLPDGPPPQAMPPDDGWKPVWDSNAGAYYYFNRFTQVTQWENPRVPQAIAAAPLPLERAPGTTATPSHYGYVNTAAKEDIHPAVANGYNPAIHGDYDPNADYAQFGKEEDTGSSVDPASSGHAAPGTANYEAVAQFNRFTGRFQHQTLTTDNFNDDNKAKRQLSAFYNVEDAANGHNGKSLKAERSGKKLKAKEVKEYKERRKARQEEKRRAWLRD